jgi:hypothetical protein
MCKPIAISIVDSYRVVAFLSTTRTLCQNVP